MSDPATEKQISYIKRLGGDPKSGLSKQAASALIDSLIKSAPATVRQLKRLARLGATVPKNLTKVKADELIEQLEGDRPPEQWQIDEIALLGGTIPKTRRDAMSAIIGLRETASATDTQRARIAELGGSLPDGCTYQRADDLIEGLERDADETEGKPATKEQLARIKKLGGDSGTAINTWRADKYIEELEQKEEDFNTRVDDALEWLFGDPDSRSVMPVKKPSKAVMQKALKYGDNQGWGEGWECKDGATEHDLMSVAVYTIAPELLKQDERPPSLQAPPPRQPRKNGRQIIIPKRTSTPRPLTSTDHHPKGKGCLVPFFLVIGGLSLGVAFMIALSAVLFPEIGDKWNEANQVPEDTARKLADPQH
ncbi:MAG: hypothetical protein A2498_13145 [Lentisphaerae bacterium RIFOXYC12_FULL_60_16]|nr:MAG: hypothetical protein A2498_13145 [Lentisphaerae bacterium RIFOXYC12_FULL_60_16]OGV82132.1 MAG: hypothetical protein A2340_02385 [Lentisphaerae bacterium RIFOXYB12_FULL_60_10]